MPKFEASSLDDFDPRVSMEDGPSVESEASLSSVSAGDEVVAATNVRAESEFEIESAPSFTSTGGDPLYDLAGRGDLPTPCRLRPKADFRG